MEEFQTPAEQLRAELELLRQWQDEGQDVEALIKGAEYLLQLALAEGGGGNEPASSKLSPPITHFEI